MLKSQTLADVDDQRDLWIFGEHRKERAKHNVHKLIEDVLSGGVSKLEEQCILN